MNCARCNRTLRRPPVLAGGMPFGPKCAAAVTGPRPRRPRVCSVAAPPCVDPRQRDLFTEARP